MLQHLCELRIFNSMLSKKFEYLAFKTLLVVYQKYKISLGLCQTNTAAGYSSAQRIFLEFYSDCISSFERDCFFDSALLYNTSFCLASDRHSRPLHLLHFTSSKLRLQKHSQGALYSFSWKTAILTWHLTSLYYSLKV